ncbi:MAG: cytochrome c oxidase subunit II [Acidobacteriota bacterium]|nr:cytochrome c oxidase subunit II [Acidobacteriota bacterium]
MTRFMPIPASAHAGDLDLIMTLVHVVVGVLFIGWLAFLTFVLFRFRRSRQPEARVEGLQSRAPARVEIAVVAAEVVLLAVFALPAWIALAGSPPENSSPLVVRVVAEQYAWNAHYAGADGVFGDTRVHMVGPGNPLGLDRAGAGADDVVTTNRIPLIKDRQVMVQLSSKDVIHSFGLPNFRVKMDAIPGMLVPVWFTPTVEGAFDVVCSQLCGLGHYRMRAVVEVIDEGAFNRFITEEAGR